MSDTVGDYFREKSLELLIQSEMFMEAADELRQWGLCGFDEDFECYYGLEPSYNGSSKQCMLRLLNQFEQEGAI
jgi:hypothetical protein